MSQTVDNRVVELDFDNKEFETGTKQSLKSIEALKKGLDFDDQAKSFSNLSKASKGFSLSKMAEGVQGISSRFSTLGIVGMTIIQNLTNAAIQYGKKLVSSIMDPMKQGFTEYETQMNAIQTVLANTESKGTTLEDVGAALDELNTYADKTIYNFSEMTRNIGTFTAAGVDLDTSTQAIKGIANLAAVSGSNSQQASTAMYQLSQALSSGTVKLMDWNSVVNAGMGGQVFQDALKDTARVSGIAIDDLIDKHGSFRETLSTGWLSSQVLLDTLQKFTGDLSAAQLKTMGYTEDQIVGILKLGETANDAATKVKTFSQLKETLQEALGSGWTKTWQLVLGDFEEAKELFTEISDTLGALIGASADSRNAILTDWKRFAGRAALIQTLRNTFEGLLSIITPIKEAFRNIFPPITGLQLANLTMMLLRLSEKLILSSENADRVKRIFAGVFSVFAIARDVVVTLVNAFFDLASAAPISGDGILEFLAKIGDFLVGVREGTDVAGGFEKAILKIKEVLTTISGYITQTKEAFLEWRKAVEETFTGIFENIDTSGIEDFLAKFKVRFKPLETILKAMGLVIGALLKGAASVIPVLFKVGGYIADFIGELGSMIVEALANTNFVEIFDTINAGLIGAILLAIRNFVSSGGGALDEVGDIFGGITEVLDGVRGSLEAWQQNLKSKTLLNIAIAIGIIAAALMVLSSIDSKKLTIALGGIAALFLQLIAAQSAMGKFGTGGLGSSAGLILMATSLLIMSAAVSKLAKIDQADMESALGVIFALMAGLLILSKFMGKNSATLITGGIGMVSVSLALLVLAQAVRSLGAIPIEEVKQGLLSVGILLAEIMVFMRLVDDKGVSKALGLLAMAGAVLILAQVVEKLGNLDVAVLQKGLASVAGVLAALAIFTRVSGKGGGMIATAIGVTILAGALEIFVDVIRKLGNMDPTKLALGLGGMAVALLIIAVAMRALPKNMILQAASLLVIAGALKIIAEAIMSMGSMTWEEIAKGLATLAGALLILTVALYAMSGTLAGSAALLVASVALLALTNVLTTLGQMPISEIGLALLALAGVFALLGIAGLILTPVVPTLLALGGAMLLIGAGTALVGLGLLMFSTGLLALAAGGAAAAIGIVAFVTTLLGLLPVIINTLIDTLIVFAKGIQRAAPEVAAAITAMMLGFLQVIIDTSPKIFETLDVLLKGLIQLIVDNIPEFVAAIVLLLLTMLQEIAAKMPDFIQAGFDILIAFLEGIRDNIAEVVTVVVEIVTEFLGAVSDNLPDIIQSGWDLIIAFIDGMATSIDNNMQPLLDALGRLATAMIDGLVAGIETGYLAVKQALSQIVMDAIAAIKKMLGIESPSKVFAKLARYIPEGIVVGLKKFGYKAVNAMTDLGEGMVDSIGFVGEAAQKLLDGELDMSPTIRPVVDMSEVVAGGKLLDNIFTDKSLNLTPVVTTTARVANGMNAVQDPSGTTINEGTEIKYVQNNYSPKALSRVEIYRQTRNQLLTAKGLVEV